MDFPGLDVKKLSDEELLRRISELHGKLLYAYSFSNSPEMVAQMQALIETLEFEQHDRIARKSFELEQRRAPKVIETEPDLVEKKEAPTQTKTKITTRTGGSGLFKRTKTPTNDQP